MIQGKLARLTAIAALAFSCGTALAENSQIPVTNNKIYHVQGCTADGTAATYVFTFYMGETYAENLKPGDYKKLQEQLEQKVTTEILPQWNRIIPKYKDSDLRHGKMGIVHEMDPAINTLLSIYGVDDEGAPNVWAEFIGDELHPDAGICPAPAP